MKQHYPYRFKTEYEFKNEFGESWWKVVDWNIWLMNDLLGKSLPIMINEVGLTSKLICNYSYNGISWKIYGTMLIENKPSYKPKNFVY